jgi:thiamine-phosphate pyrophosphorylase
LLLYYITDRTQFSGDEKARRKALLDKIAEAAACGVDYIQLREKDLSGRELESLADAAVRMVRENSRNTLPTTRLLINSRVDVAIACRADGVHLRSEDISPNDVRRIWSARRSDRPTIAVSCHTVRDVGRAAAEGADFAVFAPVFEKRDMPNAPATGLSALREVCQQKLPVLALGGVNLENARSCIEAGAAGIAGIRLFQDQDIAAVVATLQSQTRV